MHDCSVLKLLETNDSIHSFSRMALRILLDSGVVKKRIHAYLSPILPAIKIPMWMLLIRQFQSKI